MPTALVYRPAHCGRPALIIGVYDPSCELTRRRDGTEFVWGCSACGFRGYTDQFARHVTTVSDGMRTQMLDPAMA
jgi:hypothetical protein